MNTDRNIQKIIIILILGVSTFYGCNLAPGSYPYAERYEINQTENVTISAIENFLHKNPQYIVPEKTLLKNGRDGESDHWYHIYFYYAEENQIVYTWVRSSGKEKTTLALVGINEGLILGNWKLVNNDFSSSENKKVKREFENRILSKIEESL